MGKNRAYKKMWHFILCFFSDKSTSCVYIYVNNFTGLNILGSVYTDCRNINGNCMEKNKNWT